MYTESTTSPQVTANDTQSVTTFPNVIRAFGDELHLILTGEETQNQFTQVLLITPPGGGPPPHYHQNEDEWFFVLKGKVSFFVNGQWHDASPGHRVHMKKDQVHTFKNSGDEPLHMIVTTAPSGFETFMSRCAEQFEETKAQGPDMARLVEIAGEHGIYFV